MTTPRRRLIRPTPSSPPGNAQQLQNLSAKLENERRGLARWLSKLRRAFNAMDKHSQRISRLERQINKLQGA
jgi:septal ring factor EnvC (AmiA/AmiB activator)